MKDHIFKSIFLMLMIMLPVLAMAQSTDSLEMAIEEAIRLHQDDSLQYSHYDSSWIELREALELARKETRSALDEIDWEAIRREMGEASREIVEESRREIEEIDWEALRMDLERTVSHLDSLLSKF